MEKSRVIRFMGWLCLVLLSLGFGDALIGGLTIPHNPPFPAVVAAGCILLALPCFIIWLAGSIVHHMQVSSARYQARAMTEEQLRVAVAGWHPSNQVPPSSVLGLATPATAPQTKRIGSQSSPSRAEPDVYTYSVPGTPMCPKCGQRPAIFYCSTHQSAVCLECVAKHDKPGECVYVPAFRAPKPTIGEVIISGPAKPGGSKSSSVLGID